MNIVMNDRVEIGDENVGMVAENGEVSTLDKEYLDKAMCAQLSCLSKYLFKLVCSQDVSRYF